MYARHFGLKEPLHRAGASGPDVFVGPQFASVMTTLKKALGSDEAVIAVTGPVGVGKTTVTRRALDGVGDNRIIVTIGRLKLGHDEVIELLLAGLGAKQLPKGTIQRFALFRRILERYSEQGTRVFIVVEDAARLGPDALSELEALTAEDAGASTGASLVLMGSASVSELLRDPLLARLKQRVKLRQTIEPLSAPEMLAYLKHRLRLAGGEFDTIFEQDAAESIHRFSNGIPRVANTVIEQALESAAEQGLKRVSVDHIEKTAAEEIGLTAEHSRAEIREAIAEAEAAQPVAEPETPVVVETSNAEGPTVEPLPEPAKPADDDAIPELIQDTLPDLAILAPDLTGESRPDATSEPESPPSVAHDAARPEPVPAQMAVDNDAPGADPDDVPTLSDSMRLDTPEVSRTGRAEAKPAEQPAPKVDYPLDPANETPEEDVPAWERDPTFAELQPDLDALERAMEVAQGSVSQADELPPPEPDTEEESDDPTPTFVPEITLDREIQEKIEEATEALRQTHLDVNGELDGEDLPPSPGPEKVASDRPVETGLTAAADTSKPELTEDADVAAADLPESAASSENASERPPAPQRDTAQLQEIADGIANARTIEDVDDKLAETLFGAEISMIAAQVAANAPDSRPDNPGLTCEDEAPPAASESAPEPNRPASSPPPANVAAGKANGSASKLDESACHRLATVRALNQGVAPNGAPSDREDGESIVMATEPANDAAAAHPDQPETIEEQINTSITQTLKGLDLSNTPLADDEDDEGAGKRGFLGRFRRS